ncbi:ATP-grasp domain-containing protein [Herbivorax sp. ANBcel31]|uniref:ATP-grasp domain-containing protein n=1 Tax=Herbivorax sp. ANBcel31 TaxID=3069754 RepID=UPI0027AF28C0|nr:ATP-grasp domain-containing protein [Herbivorax sp. ANBcel31]MDQ2085189.1 ATP-grasp domain-containing protein [Herbivorax sp. ANBcel31]
MSAKTTESPIVLLGWSLQTIEAADKLGKPFIVVSFSDYESYAKKHNIPFLAWDYGKNPSYNEVYTRSEQLYKKLKDRNVQAVVPVFEETVEWTGALRARINDNPYYFYHSLLFRDKARMKRRALLGGLRVGIFEEATTKDHVKDFIQKIKDVYLKTHTTEYYPVHVKPFNRAGASGHKLFNRVEDVDVEMGKDNFPCLIESHLDGSEFSCEVFVFNRKIIFMNITEYVRLGYSMIVPPSPWLENYREDIRKVVQQLIDEFEVDYGFVHPEFFINKDGKISFGEVAYRVPGGHIFDLIQRTYNFNPFEAFIMCNNPNESEEEIRKIFPDEKNHNGHAGSFLVYPRVKYIKDINIPKELEDHPCFEKQDLLKPSIGKVPVHECEGFGGHYGTIFFHGQASEEIKQPLMRYVDHNFYV